MAEPVSLPPPGFDELSVNEKIDYLQSLWNRIAATPSRFRFRIGTRKHRRQRLGGILSYYYRSAA